MAATDGQDDRLRCLRARLACQEAASMAPETPLLRERPADRLRALWCVAQRHTDRGTHNIAHLRHVGTCRPTPPHKRTRARKGRDRDRPPWSVRTVLSESKRQGQSPWPSAQIRQKILFADVALRTPVRALRFDRTARSTVVAEPPVRGSRALVKNSSALSGPSTTRSLQHV